MQTLHKAREHVTGSKTRHRKKEEENKVIAYGVRLLQLMNLCCNGKNEDGKRACRSMLTLPGESSMPLWPQLLSDIICAEENVENAEFRIEAVKLLQTAYCDIDWKEYGNNMWAKNAIIDRILPILDENIVTVSQMIEDGVTLNEGNGAHAILQFLGLAAFPFINYFYESMIDYATELEENDIFLLLSKRLRDNISAFVQISESEKGKDDLIDFDLVTAQLCITSLSGIDFESFFEQENMAEKEENYKAEIESRQKQKRAAQRWKRVKALRKFVGIANANVKSKKESAIDGQISETNRAKRALTLKGINAINAVFQFAQKKAPEEAMISLFSGGLDHSGENAKGIYNTIRDVTLDLYMKRHEHVKWEDLASNFMQEMTNSQKWFPHTRNLVRRIAEERHGDPEFLVKALQVCETIVLQAPHTSKRMFSIWRFATSQRDQMIALVVTDSSHALGEICVNIILFIH